MKKHTLRQLSMALLFFGMSSFSYAAPILEANPDSAQPGWKLITWYSKLIWLHYKSV